MPQSPSWIDPDAFARNLGEPGSKEGDAASDGEGPDDVFPAVVEPAPLAESVPPSSRPTVAPSWSARGRSTASAAPVAPPPAAGALLSTLPVAALDDFERRGALFKQWMRSLVGERPFFVTDAEGQILVAERVPADRAVSAPILERALRVLRPFVGGARARGAHVQLEDGQLLQMIWNRTERGRVAVGIFGDPVLDARRVEWVSRAVERVFEKEPRP